MMSIHGQFAGEATPEYSVAPDRAIIPIHQAKSSLSKLVKRAAAGEIIYVGAYGKCEAAIVSVDLVPGKKRAVEAFGRMKGMELPEGWDDPLPGDVMDSFYGMQGLEDFEAK